MELKCEKNELLKGISIALKAVSDRSTLPVIGNLFLEAKDNYLTIISNNLEIAIKLKIPAEITKEGNILVPAKIFFNIVSKLPNETIELIVDSNKIIKVNCGYSKFNIHGLPVDDFPEIEMVKDYVKFEISSSILKDYLKRVIFAVSLDETKVVVNGVYFDKATEDETLKFVATDGFRLAKSEIKIANKEIISNIIPTKTISELINIISNLKDDTNIEIYNSKEQITFKIENILLVSRVIQGMYPKYNMIIPSSSETKLLINRKEFLEASERSLIIASEKSNIVKFEVGNNKLHITANTPSLGDVSELVDVKIEGVENSEISFNIRLILDFLKTISDEEVVIELSGNKTAGKFTVKDKDDYLYIVMPIKTA